MPCSLCRKTGHNKTTCQRKYSTDSVVVKHANGHQEIDRIRTIESAESSNNTVKYPNPKSVTHNVPSSNETSNKISYNEKSKKTATNQTPSVVNREAICNSAQSVINTVEYPKNANTKSKIHRTQTDKKSIVDLGKPTISTSRESPETVDENTKTKRNASNVDKSRINSSSSPRDLMRREARSKELEIVEPNSTNKPNTKNWNDIKIEDGDRDVLCHSAMQRFFEGPTKDEGKGYIYMYTYECDSFATGKEQTTFKIGMTKHLPERRIQGLGHDNKEKYVKVHSEEVAWRRLAEMLIHKQLTANGHHCPRKDVKGGTEWFMGSRDEILNVIHLVTRFLKIYALPLQ